MNMAKEKDNDDRERISSISDNLLIHILSKRTTRESVATSTLSKRWIKVFSGVTCLKLDDQDGCCFMFLQEMRLRTDLEKFDLSIVWRRVGNILNLIESGVQHKVELNLGLDSLSIYGILNIYLTRPIFNSSALVELKLHRVCIREILSTTSLPSLKTLSQVRV